MGAIKLIDLDQEIFVPIYDEAQDMTYEQIMTIGEMFDKFMSGYQPPIVDAIPVEWLKKRWRETLPDGVEPDFDINYAFQEVMSEWHEEQEAR